MDERNYAYVAQFGHKINTDPALNDKYALTAHIYFADGTNGIYVNAGVTLNVTGGTVENNIYLNATGNIALSGAPKLSDVNITSGAKLTLGELTEGAQILVTAKADAVVAELSADPTAYLTYIKSAVSSLAIQVDGNNLKAVAVAAG